MGIEGMIDSAGTPINGHKLALHLNNPLRDAVDIQLRLASAALNSTPGRRESVNPLAEGLDLPWELDSPHMIRHLDAGTKDAFDFSLHRPEGQPAAAISNRAPPEMEIMVHWNDPRGRVHQIALKRRVTVVPSLDVVISPNAPSLESDTGWNSAPGGGALYAWDIHGDEPRKLNPTFQMIADKDRFWVRVHVDDPEPSYWPVTRLDGAGGLPSDAVGLEWAQGERGKERVERIWALPFAPGGPELWTNSGLGSAQSELLRVDPKSGVQAAMKPAPAGGGYSLTFSLPRRLLFEEESGGPGEKPVPSAVFNITWHDNDNGQASWDRSWAREGYGPAAWGRVKLTEPSSHAP